MREFHIQQQASLPEQVASIFATLNNNGFFEDGILVGSWAMLFYQAPSGGRP